MVQLQNFPYISQLSALTSDGSFDENRSLNCVPSSICAGLQYLTRNYSFNPDQIKDAVYGQGYVGFTSAAEFVGFCAQQAVNLYPLPADPAQNPMTNDQLVHAVHEHLALGHPVIFTEPDPLPQFANDLHVCIFCAEEPGFLTSMDPLGDQTGQPFVTRSDSEWVSKLVAGQIWIMENATGVGGRVVPGGSSNGEEIVSIDLQQPIVTKYFEATPDGKWHCKQTGFEIAFGMLKFYRSYGYNAYCGLTYLGLPKTNETHIEGQPTEVVKQRFERGCLVYDPNHHFDNPPGAGDVYLMFLE